jgi:hypothetical protein
VSHNATLYLYAPPEHRPGDALGRSYTPDNVAAAIVDRVLALGVTCTWLEPCVGGGAFVRAIRARDEVGRICGVDLDRGAPGLALVDDPVLADFTMWPLVQRWGVAITNPPFGPDVGQGTTLEIARRAIVSADVCALLLPGDYLTQVGWAELVESCAEVWPIVGRVWSHTRGMVVYVWRQGHQGPGLFRPLRVRS